MTDINKRANDFLDALALELMVYSDNNDKNFECYFMPCEITAPSFTKSLGIMIASTRGEAYFLQDLRGDGWIVCFDGYSSVPLTRRYTPKMAQMDAFEFCLSTLTAPAGRSGRTRRAH